MNQIMESVEKQLYDALNYVPDGCIWAADISIIILIGMFICKFLLHKNIRWCNWFKIVPLFFFAVYIYCVLQLTILSRTVGNFGNVDMRFLVRWNESNEQKAFLIANIIMFIPLGILLPMFGKVLRHILIVFPIAMLDSIAIETIQLKYQLGFCQLDDVVANSIGFLIGYLIFLMLYDILYFVVRIFVLLSTEYYARLFPKI